MKNGISTMILFTIYFTICSLLVQYNIIPYEVIFLAIITLILINVTQNEIKLEELENKLKWEKTYY